MPEGNTLATVSDDGTVRLWDFARLAVIEASSLEDACQLTHRALNRAEWADTVPELSYLDACRT
jgi:WD40 repeat protein